MTEHFLFAMSERVCIEFLNKSFHFYIDVLVKQSKNDFVLFFCGSIYIHTMSVVNFNVFQQITMSVTNTIPSTAAIEKEYIITNIADTKLMNNSFFEI